MRPIEERDLLDLHLHEVAPNARKMAAAEKAPVDMEASLARWRRTLRDPAVTARAIDVDGALAGYVSVFLRGGVAEVAYWLDEAFWGRGHASWALGELLKLVPQRPLHARAVKDNAASIRVLEKHGFKRLREDRYFSHARGCEVDEWVFEKRSP